MSGVYGSPPYGLTGDFWGGHDFGYLAEEIPSDGPDGPGYLYPGLSFPADTGKRVRGVITRWPAGTFTVQGDSGFTYDGPDDYALYRLVVEGAPSTDDIGQGPGIGRLNLSTSGYLGGALSGNIELGPIVASGSFVGFSESTGPCANWNDVLGNGLTAGETLVQIHAMLTSLTATAIADAVWAKELP